MVGNERISRNRKERMKNTFDSLQKKIYLNQIPDYQDQYLYVESGLE